MAQRTYKLVVYVPQDHIERVKTALFDSGAGQQGNYQQCAWQTLGTGQFCPLVGSDPFIGRTGEVESVAEYRLELLCEQQYLAEAIVALKAAHPYEEPAFDIFERFNADQLV